MPAVAEATAARGGLRRLLRPVTPQRFFREHWEVRPLFVERDDPAAFTGLPSLGDVDELISTARPAAAPPAEAGLLVRAGESRPFRTTPGGLIDVQDVYRAYAEGYTVVLNRLHRRSGAVAALCHALEADLHHLVAANMYLTPARAKGFAAHVDDHDVFILQLHGEKEWHVAPDSMALAPQDERAAPVRLPEEQLRIVLRPGDVLYIPRGVAHEAVTGGASSLHLTIGVHVHTWADLLATAVGLLAEDRMALRQALPPGHLEIPVDRARLEEILDDLRDALLDGDLAGRAAARLGSRLLADVKAARTGHFRSLDGLRHLAPDAVVVRAPGSLCRVRRVGDEALIEFAGNFVTGPAETEPALRFVAEYERFAVAELPGEITVQDRLDLVSRLISEGLLLLSDPATSGGEPP